MPRRSPQKSPKSSARGGNTRSGSIRIIAGQWRGRKLKVLDGEGLRPTTDRVKETLFNWLAMDIRGARCLDAFAGSGGLGFEALSRYAEHVTLVERDQRAAQQLKDNLALLQVDATQAKLEVADTLQLLRKEPEHAYDVVFIDPPFHQQLVQQCIDLLVANNWLADDALVYLEQESSAAEPNLPSGWEKIKSKQAGQVSYNLYHIEHA
ncbi:16S rRNA (guanine(966)-N(2))-methyltransferase RsmD [Aliagarivorans taiwanensis]|uniref:16S rRNA (guanine(966)-N(2))-methyltransferase RsmD n=1 Tax=Aliagarivorans taiwanensis TaxID=561966 RepID=UPI0004223C67|nr:16S rRNA (guanine(966)-N(2))-methyltransferase RsmD [Aliagarivorans taiwanensis]